jgi:gliding motility-associated lipoprotein GldD
VHIAPHFGWFFCEFYKANLMRFTQLSTLVLFFAACSTFSWSACDSSSEVVAKPHAFPKIEFPKSDAGQTFDKNFCHFSFKYPKYVAFEQDTSYFGGKTKDVCWFNLVYPTLNARVHCSYYPINSANKLDKLVADAYDLAGKHNIKADYIDELPVQKPNHVSGMIFDIQGAAASPFQFYLTDSTHHFFRGSLYFNTQARPDSLEPVFNFVKTDIIQIINTFEWNK